MPRIVFLSHCGVRTSVMSEKGQILHLIRTSVQQWTEDNCRRVYSVHCRVIVDNRCEFQHFSSHDECNFDARLVS